MGERSPTRASTTPRSERTSVPIDLRKGSALSADPALILDEINALRLETTKLDTETRQIRSKTAHIKHIIHDRDCAIKKALSITDDREQNIKTASESTLRQLRENIASLRNTLESRQEELDRVMQQDKLAVSDELHIEVLEYFCELDRLKQQCATVHEGEAVINSELGRLRQLIAQSRAVERRVCDLQLQNDHLREKSEAYRRGEERIESGSAAERIGAGGIVKEDVFLEQQRELNAQIQELTETQARLKAEISQVHENDQQNRRYLQSLIDEQADRIGEATSVNPPPRKAPRSSVQALRK
jgi:hypothetical protein